MAWRRRHVTLACAALALAGSGGVDRAAAQAFAPSDLSVRPVAEEELLALPCGDLWYLRNAVFAARGYRFKTPRGIAAFGNAGIYDDPPLSPLERANVATIARVEGVKGCR